MNIVDAAQSAFGAIGKYAVSVIIISYLAISALVALGEFSHLTKLISFPTAPTLFVSVFISLGAVFAVFAGFKAILRLHGIFIPLIWVAIALLIVSTIYKGDVSNLFPILGTGTENLLGKGLSGIVVYTDILLLFLIAPEEKTRKQINRTVLRSTGLGVLINVLFVLAFNLSVPYSTSSGDHSPIYLLLKEVYYGRFFQRIDAIILFVSSISAMLYLALNTFLFGNLLRQTFKTKNIRPITLIYTLVIFALASGSSLIPSGILTYLIFMCGFSALFTVLIVLLFVKRRTNFGDSK